MANDTVGRFLSGILDKAHERGEAHRKDQEKQRDDEISFYRDAVKTALAAGDMEKAQIGLAKIDQLSKMPKGKSPFGKMAEWLKQIGGKGGQGGEQAQDGGQSGTPNATGGGGKGVPQPAGAAPGLSGGGGAQPDTSGSTAPKSLPSLDGTDQTSRPGPGKQTGGMIGKAFSKVGKGLMAGAGAVTGGLSKLGDAITPSYAPLPPLDPRVLTSGPQAAAAEAKAKRETGEEDAQFKIDAAIKDWKKRTGRDPSDQQIEDIENSIRGVKPTVETAQAKAQRAMDAKQKYPGQAIISALPESEQANLTDANGLPVDPNGLYGPTDGEALTIDYTEEGHPVLTGVRVGSGSAREGTTEQLAIDPKTNELVAVQLKRTTGAPPPPKGKQSDNAPTPTLKTRGGAGTSLPALQDGKPASGNGAGKHTLPSLGGSGSSTPGARRIGPYVRPQQANVLQKQAVAIDEARNSLIGDDPKSLGGFARDLTVFQNPDSVRKLSEYIGFIDSQVAAGERTASAGGIGAVADWYFGLPGQVTDLIAQAKRDKSLTLNPEEEKFIADYYRVMGTIGGMRAATGASAAKWSFQNIKSELPTPGPVTSYDEAMRRLMNFVQETNVVASRNLYERDRKVDVDKMRKEAGGADSDIVTWTTDDQGNPVPSQPAKK